MVDLPSLKDSARDNSNFLFALVAHRLPKQATPLSGLWGRDFHPSLSVILYPVRDYSITTHNHQRTGLEISINGFAYSKLHPHRLFDPHIVQVEVYHLAMCDIKHL